MVSSPLAPDVVLLSPCSGPVRGAAPAGVEAVVFSLAEGLRRVCGVHVVATHDSELPGGVFHHPCSRSGLAEVTGRLLARWPAASFCDHSGAAIDEMGASRFFRVFHVEPRYVFTPHTPQRCGFVSEYLRRLFSTQRNPHFSECPVLHNGVDPGNLAGLVASPCCSAGRDVVYIGRINRLKGLDLGVAACSSLGVRLQVHGGLGPGHEPDVVFNDLPLLEELTRLYPAGFEYHGPLSDAARKREILAGAAAVLIPSREAESCSLVALEAVAAGVAVVTFRRGGVVEYLENHPGVFFADYTGHSEEDALALAAALCQAMRSPGVGPSLPGRYTAAAMVERYRAWLARG